MLRDVHELHKYGIVVRDIKGDQYVRGTLVDFSQALVTPNICGSEGGLEPAWTLVSWAAWDLYSFQKFVIDPWNKIDWPDARPPKCTLQAYPNDNSYLDRLRTSHPQQQRPFYPY